MVTYSPFFSPFLWRRREQNPLGSSLTVCTEEKMYLPWGLKFHWINVAQSQVWRSFHLIAFSKWDEDKLLDLDAGTGSSGIQTPATVSDLCMSQHLSESSLLFSCSSPLQVVFHSRYKQQYETKFREERDFWCRAREDGSLCDYRHPKTGD